MAPDHLRIHVTAVIYTTRRGLSVTREAVARHRVAQHKAGHQGQEDTEKYIYNLPGREKQVRNEG